MKIDKKAADSYKPEVMLHLLRNGEARLRNILIKNNQDYILSIVSKLIRKPSELSEAFNIALQAFHEAIDRFNEEKNISFLYFAGLVINRRVIEYIRKSDKYDADYSFSYHDAMNDENYLEKLYAEKPNLFADKLEIQEYLLQFKDDLLSYGIRFEDLLRQAPKAPEEKLLCLFIAKKLTESKELSDKVYSERRLPINALSEALPIKQKMVENYRKYIIALFLVLSSDMEILKGYSNFLLKGVNQ